MGEHFDLDIDLNYRLRTGYNRLLKPREWVRGLLVEVTISVTNRSPKAFPRTKIDTTIIEHGQSVGIKSLTWTTLSQIEIPQLEAGSSTKLEAFAFVPLIEGLCEIKLNLGEPTDSEIWIRGWRQSEPRRKEITGYFYVVRWQELEMLKLLMKLEKGG